MSHLDYEIEEQRFFLILGDAFHDAANGEVRRGYVKLTAFRFRLVKLDPQQYPWVRGLAELVERSLAEYVVPYPAASHSAGASAEESP